MNRKLLYINNELVDLYPDTVIAQTLQAFEVGKLGSVRLNYTNRVKVPKTGNNCQILGFADSTKSTTSMPYTCASARYVEDGIEIIRNGIAKIDEAGNDFTLMIRSGPAGFFDFIKTKKLWDLDLSDLNGGWDDTAQDGYRNATSGIVAPLIHDGRLLFSSPNIERKGSLTKHPFIYYHTVIAQIFADAGYKVEGDIFNDAFYKAHVIPLSVIYAPQFTQAKAFSAAATGTQQIVDPASYVNVQFPNVSFQGDDNFYDGVDEYTVVNPDTALGYFIAQFRAHLSITVTGGTVDIVLEAGPSSNTQSNVGTGYYELAVTPTSMGDGNVARVKIIKVSGTPTVDIDSGVFYNVPRTGITGDEFITTLDSDFVYFNLLFEDMNQIDFLADFSVRFNVKMTERSGVIICKTMNEILADTANQLDWTAKRVKGEEIVRYAYNGLARNNEFTYPNDEFAPDLSGDYAKGVFTIANNNLDETVTIYSSPFAMSQMINTFEVFMADMDIEPNSGNFGRNPGMRLYLVRDKYTEDPNVIYDSVARSDYKVAYFIDARQDYSLHWQYYIDNYYADFVTRLQKAKLVVREYRLSQIDIHAFDQLKLVHDNSETFIVSKINNYQSGQATKVELFKV